ncbi:MAG: cytochrome c oxidase assembly factor Coa1 family protein [Lysobacteraceae bacterium]
MTPARDPAAPARPGWWQRHWTWAVPALAITGLVLCAALGFALVATILGVMRDHEVYRTALEHARRDRSVAAALGTPIEPSWWMSAEVRTANGGGHARYDIPIAGPRGKAMLFVEARSRLGVWKFGTLAVTVDGSARPIDLLPGLPAERRLGTSDATEAGHDDDTPEPAIGPAVPNGKF